MGYDADGNPLTISDANQHITAATFDLLGELGQKILPDGTLIEKRQYDAAGNLTGLTHFNGAVTSYTYDALNRLLSRTTPGDAPVSFTYTATGKRATMTDASGSTSYSYDAMDRLATKATPEGTLNYSYDAAGNLASMASNHTNGVNVTYAYDSHNRLSSVVDANLPSGANTTTYNYDPAYNLVEVQYPNGVQSTMSYDALNRITELSSQNSNYQYQRDSAGKLTQVVEQSGRTVDWNYDGINRLTGESITLDPQNNNGTISYGLDPVGNRLTESSTVAEIPSGSFGYNSDDESSNEVYDANGSVLQSAGRTFVYDSQNQLIAMTAGGPNGPVTLVYDGDGNRVAKSASGATTFYLIDDLNPTGFTQTVEEVSTAGSVQRQYTYGFQRIDQKQLSSGAWTTSFYGYDEGGNVRQLTSLSGSPTDTYVYDGFGNIVDHTGTTPNTYQYRGEYSDSNLECYYMRARYYNPVSGRFLSRDPENGLTTDPSTLHKYSYAGMDPINLEDINGRSQAQAVKGVYAPGGGVGEYIGVTLAVVAGAGLLAKPGVHSGLQSATDAINCYALADSSEASAWVQFGIDGDPKNGIVERDGPCSFTEKDKCPALHPDWPVNYVSLALTPTIALHIKAAQGAGYPDGLTYLGPLNPQTGVNRAAACPPAKYAPLSCDEYPYASTQQGGIPAIPGLPASTMGVPLPEQFIQGGQLSAFYRRLAPGQSFCVVVGP